MAAHAVGLDALSAVVEEYTPARVADICGVEADDVRAAAEVFGTSERVLSTVLQGFYQSHQATAASVQVNNLHLLRGMLGRPGAGIYQMNGQPTVQNNRETGVDGDLSGFRNWDNPDHVQEMADLWDVDPLVIPHRAPPTPAMQLFRYAEQGSIGFLWIAGTNPAVSMPDLARIRRILADENLFVVVNEAYLNETAQLADVVLPAALWAEKTGTFTNVDRTVHLSDRAVDPPGQARSDLDIWVHYARRMGFRDRNGRCIPSWDTPEGAFDGWRERSRGRPCDYSAMAYDALRGGSGIQWPCTDDAQGGTERIHTDHDFNTFTDYCETYGHDLLTGAAVDSTGHSALRLDGKAQLKGATWTPGPGQPDEEYPLVLSTGRTAFHFHTRTRTRTRTKTMRAPELQAAAPDAWVEISLADADRLGIAEGDLVRVESARGAIEVAARVSGVREGTVFVPFHYGDVDSPGGRRRAANELTITAWDPVSKQPQFKTAAVRLTRLEAGTGPAPAPTNTASAPVAPLHGADGAAAHPGEGA